MTVSLNGKYFPHISVRVDEQYHAFSPCQQNSRFFFLHNFPGQMLLTLTGTHMRARDTLSHDAAVLRGRYGKPNTCTQNVLLLLFFFGFAACVLDHMSLRPKG